MMILSLQVIVNLILVTAIDPGIIPRSTQQSSVEDTGSSNGSRRKKVTINGVQLKLKYCRICRIFRPPRSCHCAICDNCVENFDHHCPWIGQCIALVWSACFHIHFISKYLTETSLFYAEKLSVLFDILDNSTSVLYLHICFLLLEDSPKNVGKWYRVVWNAEELPWNLGIDIV